MNEKNDDETKNGEQKPKPDFESTSESKSVRGRNEKSESGSMRDIKTIRRMAKVNLKAALESGSSGSMVRRNPVEYGAALHEISREIVSIVTRITEIAATLGRIHDLLKAVDK